MSVHSEIEQKVVGYLSAIPGLDRAYDHEPQRLPSYPMTTLLVAGFNPTQAETGSSANEPGDDVLYQWRLRLYVALTDYEKAQAKIKELIPLIIAINRDYPTAEGLVDFLRIRDPGGTPEFSEEDGWASYDLILSAEVTEQ